jgi:hypothetical protein
MPVAIIVGPLSFRTVAVAPCVRDVGGRRFKSCHSDQRLPQSHIQTGTGCGHRFVAEQICVSGKR